MVMARADAEIRDTCEVGELGASKGSGRMYIGDKLLFYLQECVCVSVAAPGGFLGFLETSQDSGSTDQIVNTDGPLPAAVTVNKTP